MSCVIFGAGKIARGFIGHLLYLSGIPFTFIEREKPLADLLNTRGRYTVNILGHSEKNCQVTGDGKPIILHHKLIVFCSKFPVDPIHFIPWPV